MTNMQSHLNSLQAIACKIAIGTWSYGRMVVWLGTSVVIAFLVGYVV